MDPKVNYATPMFHVREIEASIAFYELLGFTTIDTDDGRPLDWARLHCEGGAVMFLRAEHPLEAPLEGVMFTMYTPDLAAFRERMLASGVTASEIKYPAYMPSGELYLHDPDGLTVQVIHWGKQEQEKWERHLEERASRKRGQ